MGKLHEILAVENGLGETANRVTKETTKTLADKRAIFEGMTKSNTIFDEEQQHLVAATERKEVQTTVPEQLFYLANELAAYWDCILQKEEANQRATANIIIDGHTIAEGVPAIVLLGMEKKLSTLLSTYNSIPTLDAAKTWTTAEGYAKPNVFQLKHSEERQQTKVEKEFVTIAPATDRHPAQVVQQDKTTVIGKWTIDSFSGAISSHDKAEKLKRLTTLIRAVKQARMRANDIEVNSQLTFGKSLMDYING